MSKAQQREHNTSFVTVCHGNNNNLVEFLDKNGYARYMDHRINVRFSWRHM